MSGPRDGFKKIHRTGKTKEEIELKNFDPFDLIDDSEDEDEGDEDSYLDDKNKHQQSSKKTLRKER